jgi:F-box/TPR repeat protein Pof3
MLIKFSICLSVSKGWKNFLEGQPDLWTELDTTYCRKPMSKKALLIHLRRSKYTLDSALITMKANIDREKMRLLMRTCKELRELRIHGQGLIGESLSDSVPAAKNLKVLHVSHLTEASLGTVQSCMRTCQQIEDIKFGKVQGSATSLRDGAWTVAKNENIKTLELQSNKKSRLDIVSLAS